MKLLTFVSIIAVLSVVLFKTVEPTLHSYATMNTTTQAIAELNL